MFTYLLELPGAICDKIVQVTILAVYGSILSALSGCGNNLPYEGPERFPVTGQVKFDGEAVDNGIISFIPIGDGRVAGGPIIGGNYSVVPEKGPTAGEYRIEVKWPKPTGKKGRSDTDGESGEQVDIYTESIPPKFNTRSTLTASVSKESTVFDFDLTSK